MPSPSTLLIGRRDDNVFSESEAVISKLSPVTLNRKLSRIVMVFLALITLLTPERVE